MTNRQITALNNLYAATVEVMQAFNPQMVDSQMRNQVLAGMIDNFMRGMSVCAQSTPAGETDDQVEDLQFAKDPPKQEGYQTTFTPPTDSSDPLNCESSPTGVNMVEEVRYGVKPTFVDDEWLFKRIKLKEDCDSGETFYYELNITGDSGTFRLNTATATPEVLDSSLIPETIVKVEGSASRTSATSVSNVKPGRVVKERKSWKVVEPLVIRFS